MATSRFYHSLAMASILALTTWGCSLETLNQRSIWEEEHSDDDGHDHTDETNSGSDNSVPSTSGTTTGGTTTGGTTTGDTTTGGTTTGDTTGGTTTGGTTGGGTTTVTYTNDVAPIMNASCAGCHGSSGGVSLKTKDDVQKNFSASLTAIEAGTMPKGGSKLSTDKITILKNWQAAGFPN